MGNVKTLQEMFEAANGGTSKEIKRRETAKKKVAEKLEKKRDREVANIRAKYDKKIVKAKTSFDEKLRAAYDIYDRRASKLVLRQLREDYGIMQRRSDLVKVLSDGESGIALKALLDKVETAEGKRKIMAAYMEATGRGVNEHVQHDDLQTPQDIISYIAESKGKCFLVLPIDGKENKELTQSLEEKVDAVLNQRSVISGTTSVNFTSDADEHNSGFLFYTIDRNATERQVDLDDALVNKFDELQPDGFKEAGLTHRVMKLDYIILSYFLNHKETEMFSPIDAVAEYESEGKKYLSIAETSGVLGTIDKIVKRFVTQRHLKYDEEKGISLRSIRRYLSRKGKRPIGTRKGIGSSVKVSDIERKRIEAMNRMNEFDGNFLSTEQLAYVLGVKVPYGALHNMRRVRGSKIEIVPREDGEKASYLIPKKEIKTFMQKYEPSKRGWREPGK